MKVDHTDSSTQIPVKQLQSHRTLTFHIFRFNPYEEGQTPSIQTYELEEADAMTLYIALNDIRQHQDPSLQFDFVCRAGICGSCAMLVNGRPTLACKTLTKDLPSDIHLAPLPGFELIADLSVDTGKWMRSMSENLKTWINAKEKEIDLCAMEEKMEPDMAEQIYELERCIECGCCISACGTAQMKPSFVGAVGVLQLARFRLDPRDMRTDADYFEVLGTEDGVFGCMTLLGCEDMCPKSLPLAQQIAFMRRKMAQQSFKLFNQ